LFPLELVLRVVLEDWPLDREEVDDLLERLVVRVPRERLVLLPEERPDVPDCVTALRSLSKSLSMFRLVLAASRRSAFIVLVNSL
jgi:hypothetical protein